MPTFWENVLQLARFFISSVTGLIFIILSPFINLKRSPLFLIIIMGSFFLGIVSLYQVLQAMLGVNDTVNTL
nr:Ycf33 [Erythrotrichia carnea]